MSEGMQGRVLIVDDELPLLRLYKRVLEKSGFETVTASDGRSAVGLYEQEEFDLIISDIGMPGMGGIGLLRAIRASDLDVPVILMTANPVVESAAEAVELGAMRYLIKPIDLGLLRETAQRAARLHQLAKAKRQALAYLGVMGTQVGDLAGLDASFGRCLRSLWMAYQPIILLSERRVYGYEALLRSTESTLPGPGAVLDAADRLQRLSELGRAIRARVALDIAELPEDALVFVNLHPEDLFDDDLVEGRSPLAPFASRVVLEITERATLDGIKDVRARVRALRAQKYRIAVDDLGAGYAGLSSFAHLEPDIVKLDMSLVREISRDATKQQLVGTLTRLCADLHIRSVCEGIETAEERDTLLALGCDLLQGYLFARPARGIAPITW